MKKIIPEYVFDEEQLNKIDALARSLRLTPSLVRILFARGVDDKEKIERFIAPGKKNFLSPYLMSGMKETVETLKTARDEGWRVAIFGDYDADGICASTIMYNALNEFGIECVVYVPERSEGYGLSIPAIDKILDEFFPDLFITVDCGISNAAQVKYIQEQGVYVIVSDHHELPEVIPDCICVNPKFDDDYPYDNLCGAGVAFKIAVALLGENAYKYLDYAALATVADSVPLLGENRDIVAEGLNLIRNEPRTSFSCLLGKSDNEITAQTLAFNIAPKINAAGRMGDANAALSLFLAESQSEVFTLAAKLQEYNVERQKCCDQLYESAKSKLAQKGAYGNVIMLSDENWSSGFVGIVAARITEEYCRPTILFVKNGDKLKGSARSIDSVNIYEALKNCSEYISEFGGHSQAAGVNVTEENFEILEQKLNEYMSKTYTPEDFIPTVCVSEELSEEFSPKLAKELNSLEPCGVGNKKPLFSIKANAVSAREIKQGSKHVAIKSDCIDMMFFGGIKHLKMLESNVEKQIVFECNISKFKGKEYIKGYVKDVIYNVLNGNVSTGIFSNTVSKLSGEQVRPIVRYLTGAETQAMIKERLERCEYGVCLIASSRKELNLYPELNVRNIDLYTPSSKNVANTVLISPSRDADLSAYNCVIFLDEPTDYNIASLEGREVFVNRDVCGYAKIVNKIDTERVRLLEIFSGIRKDAGRISGASVEETARAYGEMGFDEYEYIFALSVFEELGLLSYSSGKIEIYRGIKVDLNDSFIYSKINYLKKLKK